MFGSTSTLILVYIGEDGFGLHTVGVEHVGLHQDEFLVTWHSASARLACDLRGVVIGVVR